MEDGDHNGGTKESTPSRARTCNLRFRSYLSCEGHFLVTLRLGESRCHRDRSYRRGADLRVNLGTFSVPVPTCYRPSVSGARRSLPRRNRDASAGDCVITIVIIQVRRGPQLTAL